MGDVRLRIKATEEVSPAMLQAVAALEKFNQTQAQTFQAYNVNAEKVMASTAKMSQGTVQSAAVTEQQTRSWREMATTAARTAEKIITISSAIGHVIGFERSVSIMNGTINKLQELFLKLAASMEGTPFAKLAPIVLKFAGSFDFLRQALGSLVVSSDLSKSSLGRVVTEMSKSSMAAKLLGGATIGLVEKIQFWGEGMQFAGRAMQVTDSWLTRMAGHVVQLTGVLVEFTGDAIADLDDVAIGAVAVAGAFAAMATIDSLFIATNKAITVVDTSLRGLQTKLWDFEQATKQVDMFPGGVNAIVTMNKYDIASDSVLGRVRNLYYEAKVFKREFTGNMIVTLEQTADALAKMATQVGSSGLIIGKEMVGAVKQLGRAGAQIPTIWSGINTSMSGKEALTVWRQNMKSFAENKEVVAAVSNIKDSFGTITAEFRNAAVAIKDTPLFQALLDGASNAMKILGRFGATTASSVSGGFAKLYNTFTSNGATLVQWAFDTAGKIKVALVAGYEKALEGAAKLASKMADKLAPAQAALKVGPAAGPALYTIDARTFDNFQELKLLMNKAEGAALSLAQNGLIAVRGGLEWFRNALANGRSTLTIFTDTTIQTGKAVWGFGSAFVQAARNSEFFNKGIMGFLNKTGTAGTVMALLGEAMTKSDNVMVRMSGYTLVALALAMGGFALIMRQVIAAAADVVIAIGNKLVSAAQKATNEFIKVEQVTHSFEYTMSSLAASAGGDGVKAISEWTGYIEELGRKTGSSGEELKGAAQDIAQATSSFKLSSDVQKELLKLAVDMSEQSGKPIADAARALTMGIAGSEKALRDFGIRMDDNQVKMSKSAEGVRSYYDVLPEQQKAQIRTNALFERTNYLAGYSASAWGTAAKAAKYSESVWSDLNAELGRGANLVEGPMMAALTRLIQGLGDLVSPMLPLIGFFEALFGRILQGTGYLLKHILLIGSMILMYKSLNTLLAANTFQNFLLKPIPFINKNFYELITAMGGTGKAITSVGGLAKEGLGIFISKGKEAFLAMMNIGPILNIVAAGLKSLVVAAWPIALIAAAVWLVWEALKYIESETKIFSDTWARITALFKGSSTEFSGLSKIITSVAHVFKNIFGFAVKEVAALLTVMAGAIPGIGVALTKTFPNVAKKMGVTKDMVKSLEQSFQSAMGHAKKFALGGVDNLTTSFSSNAIAAEHNAKVQAAAAAKIQQELTEAFDQAKVDYDVLKKKMEPFSNIGAINEAKINTAVAIEEERKRLSELKLIATAETRARLDEQLKWINARRGLASQEIDNEMLIAQAIVASRFNVLRASLTQEKALIEQRQALHSQMKGQTGQVLVSQDSQANELNAEQVNQTNIEQIKASGYARLQKQYDRHVITMQQMKAKQAEFDAEFEQNMMNSEINAYQIRLEREREQLNMKAQLLSASAEGTAVLLEAEKLAYEQNVTDIEMARLNSLMNDQEYKAALEQSELDHLARMNEIKEKQLQDEITRAEKTRNAWAKAGAQIRLQQEKDGKILGVINGIQQTDQYKAMQSSLSDLSSLMQSSNETAFDIGRGAAIAQATVQTFLGATAAYTGMLLSFPGPIGVGLGVAAAAAAVASGMMNVEKIRSQKFQRGGQAHEGIESVPHSLKDKTFTVEGGERIIKTNQNAELGKAIDKINSGQSGANYYITINANGSADSDSIERIKKAVIEGIREASERGQPVISERGIIRSA